MSGSRCPNCGGLVAPDAAWCGQCLTRLDRPAGSDPSVEAATRTPASEAGSAPERPPPGPAAVPGAAAVRADGDEVVWACPTCGRENPIEAAGCAACGTPFGRLLEEAPEARPVEPARLLAYSLLFPGAGHVAGGRVAEGLARAVVFGFAIGTVVAVFVARRGLGLGPFVPLVTVLVAAAAVLYGLTAADAGRLARGRPPLLTTRMLLYTATGLMLLTVVVLVVSGLRATGT